MPIEEEWRDGTENISEFDNKIIKLIRKMISRIIIYNGYFFMCLHYVVSLPK